MKKYKFTNNLGLKIMALVFAACLWLIVVNIDDPVETSTFRNIPVTVQNAKAVTNLGMTYTILDDTESVSVVVKAKRSVLAKISASDIEATADMAEMQIKSLVPITATVKSFEGQYTAEATPGNLKVKIEDETMKVFPLTVSTSGTPRDGYVIDYSAMTTNPESISVTGSESLVSSIDKAVAKVDVSGISKSEVLTAELVYFDSNGNPVSRSQLEDNLGEEGVTVDVTVLNTKSVGLDFSVSGSPADGYVYGGLTCEPEQIQVCGSEEALASLIAIEIPSYEIDLSQATEKFEKTVDILPYLPEGIGLVDETASNILVTVTIEQEGARTIELTTGTIQVNNLQENLNISYETNTVIELQFKGPQEMLDALDLRNAVSIDMKTHKKPGTYDVPVDVILDEKVASSVVLTKQPVIKVKVTEKDDEKTITDSSETKDKE